MEDEPASFLSQKVRIREFGCCVRNLSDFLKVAILVFLAISQMDDAARLRTYVVHVLESSRTFSTVAFKL